MTTSRMAFVAAAASVGTRRSDSVGGIGQGRHKSGDQRPDGDQTDADLGRLLDGFTFAA